MQQVGPPVAGEWGQLVAAGARLADLHLHYEQAALYPLQMVPTAMPVQWRVGKGMKLDRERGTITYNEPLRLEGVPADALAYRLGNRSALEWIIDQYQVYQDPRSGITSDPNQPGNERAIVELMQRVITVSLATVRLERELAAVRLAMMASGRCGRAGWRESGRCSKRVGNEGAVR